MPLTKWGRWKILATDLSGIGYLDTRHALPFIVPTLKLIDVIAPTIFWTIAITIAVKLNVGCIPLYWTIAFVTSYWAMFRQRALTEHIGTDSTHKIIANPIQRFFYLPHNTWYHFEHHINANVPCWNLPKIRALSKDKDFFRSTRCLRTSQKLNLNPHKRNTAHHQPQQHTKNKWHKSD